MSNKLTVIKKSYTKWNYLNPILKGNQVGIISAGKDLGKSKQGNGVTPWRDLPYRTVNETSGDSFPYPDRDKATQVLSAAGTWTAAGDGYVKHLTGVTNSTTPYITFTMTINGMPELIEERTGLLTTGIYNWVSQDSIVKAGDVIKTTQDGGGSHITNQVLFMPVKY